MSNPNCKDCIKKLAKHKHSCMRHADCFLDNTWNPGNCSCCLELFRLADSSDTPNDYSNHLVYQVQRVLSSMNEPGLHGSIFGKQLIFERFQRPWLNRLIFKLSKKSGSEISLPDASSASKNKSFSEEQCTSQIDLGGSSDHYVVQHISPVSAQEDPVGVAFSENLDLQIPDLNFAENFLSTSAPFSSSLAAPTFSVQSTSGSIPTAAHGSPIFSQVDISSLVESEVQKVLSKVHPSKAAPAPPTFSQVSQAGLSALIDSHVQRALAKVTSSEHVVSSRRENEVVTERNFPLRSNSNLENIDPTLNNADSEVDEEHCSDSDNEEEEFTSIHWPDMVPVTSVNAEMISFLNQEKAPPLFSFPANWEVSAGKLGLILDNQLISSEDIFLGTIDGKLYAVLKEKSVQMAELALSLNRVFSLDERKLMTWSKIKELLASYCDYADKQFNPCSYEMTKDNKFSLTIDSLDLASLGTPTKSRSSPFSMKFLSLNSYNESDDSILKFLQAPMLDGESHILEGSVQDKLTSSLSKEIRSEDASIRADSLTSVTALAVVKELDKAISFIGENASNQTRSEPWFAMFHGLKGLSELALNSLETLSSNFLQSAVEKRKVLRTKATEFIREENVKKKLLENKLFSPSLFSDEASKMVNDSILQPAPRAIPTGPKKGQTKPATKSLNGPSNVNFKDSKDDGVQKILALLTNKSSNFRGRSSNFRGNFSNFRGNSSNFRGNHSNYRRNDYSNYNNDYSNNDSFSHYNRNEPSTSHGNFRSFKPPYHSTSGFSQSRGHRGRGRGTPRQRGSSSRGRGEFKKF